MNILAIFLVSTSYFFFAICQSTEPSTNGGESKLNPGWSYCMEFTWVGPAFDNFTRFNETCGDYLDRTRSKNVPCSPPIVITEDGTPPNIDFLFENHKSSVLCKRTASQFCATYVYKFDGQVINSTYMCTTAKNAAGGSLGAGCYTQKVDGYEIETCLCKSTNGLYKPCNAKLVDYF